MLYDEKMTNEELRPLPMSETTFYILYSLMTGPMHGYGIMKKVKEVTNNDVIIGAGTLYGALDNLTRQAMIKKVTGIGDEPRRKYYEITPEGEAAVRWEFNRLTQVVKNTEDIFKK